MEEGFRIIKCPGFECGAKLRLKDLEEKRGKKIKIICPICQTEIITRVPVVFKNELDEEESEDVVSDFLDGTSDFLGDFRDFLGRLKK